MTEKTKRRIKLSQQALDGLNAENIPAYMHGSIIRYVEDGIRPGDFLTAIICNDLTAAVGGADDMNKKRLANYVTWFVWYAPASCWGSKEAYEAWVSS